MMRGFFGCFALCCFALQAQTDWPVWGHDAGGTRFSPLKQINTYNVSKLQLVWSYDTLAPVAPAPGRATAPPPAAPGAAPGRAGRGPRARRSETTPLVVNGVLY